MMKPRSAFLALFAALAAAAGCRNHMPHAFTWPGGGDITPSHAKPPEGGYYSDWDPYAVELEVTPVDDVNPVRTQHFVVATVKDKDGRPLPNRRIEWIINSGSVGDFVEVDESGWRNSRGYLVDNHRAVTHTNNFDHVLTFGDSDPSNDVTLTAGQSWAVITSPIEGETFLTVYAPGIFDQSKHKVFATKRWYDVKWEFPPPATNPTGTTHEFVTRVMKYGDNSPLVGYQVNYKIVDGPDGSFDGGGKTASVTTNSAGEARVTLRQSAPKEGTNNIAIEIIRPENLQCCKPAVKIAEGRTAKTWIGPKIAIDKSAPATALAGAEFQYQIVVSNPSQVAATNVVVTDVLPDGIQYVSSAPSAQASGQSLSWSLGSLAGGAKSNITVTVKGTRTGKFDNCAEVRADQGLSARDCAPTVISAPQLAIEKRCPAEVLICEPIEYVIAVRNSGDGVARNVRITDQLDQSLQAAGQTSWSVGDLNPGETKEVRLSAKATRGGSFTNRAVAVAEGGLTAEASCVTRVGEPKLAVQKSATRTEMFIGRPAEFQIVVSNTGNAPARNTVLRDPIPTGFSFTGASDGGSMSGGAVVWNLGTIDPGQSKSVTLSGTVSGAGEVRNTATATAICTEASGNALLVAKGIPAILLEVIDIEDPIEIGSNTTYVITVTNQGSADGTNIVVECTLPPQQDYVSAEGATPGTATGKVVRFSPVPVLAPQAKATFRVTIKGTQAGDTRFQVSMKSDQIDSTVNETESTRVY